MRIGFNGQRLAGQRFGVGRYIEYMLRHWSTMLGVSDEVELFLRRPLEADLAHLPGIHPIVKGPDMPGVLWENVRLRWPASRLDVLFCPAYTAPVWYPGRLVVATHSVNEIQDTAHGWWYQQRFGRLNRHCARHADAVIVPAESTKADLTRLYGVPSERIAVVHQGADDAFRPMNDPAALQAVRKRFFGEDRPYILFVGKCSTRRNIPVLIRAFAKLRHEQRIPHGLLLFGPNVADQPLDALCRELGIGADVVQTDGVVASHAELVPIYNAADVFVHPSEYEGWSMTTIEALACGTAVVAANRGGLGEVAAGYALMVDDPTVEPLADAIGRVLSDDRLRKELQQKARVRGAALRWQETTKQTLEVVQRVARAQHRFEGALA
jgi:glycosyltransferase involved in cell wall biosynthesis